MIRDVAIIVAIGVLLLWLLTCALPAVCFYYGWFIVLP